MSTFILQDRYFDPESGRISSYFCQLFILIGQESLQYSILDTEKNTFIALADYRLPAFPKTPENFNFRLDEFFAGEEVLLKKYPSVIIGIDTPWHTLVPSPLYDAGLLTNYLEFNFRLPDGFEVTSDQVSEIDAFNIYGFLPGLKNVIYKYFRETAIVHRSTALIRAIYQHQRINPDPPSAYLHVREQFLDLVFFEGNRPAFVNSFPFRSKEDILYFTLHTIGQLKLRPDALQLYISGLMDPGTDAYLLMEQYIGRISFSGRIDSFNYSPLLNQAPSHHFQELFALALCGL